MVYMLMHEDRYGIEQLQRHCQRADDQFCHVNIDSHDTQKLLDQHVKHAQCEGLGNNVCENMASAGFRASFNCAPDSPLSCARSMLVTVAQSRRQDWLDMTL